jgi:hypothetical protein
MTDRRNARAGRPLTAPVNSRAKLPAQTQSGRTNESCCLTVLKNRSVTCVRGRRWSAVARGDDHGQTCGIARNRNPTTG